MYHDLHDFLDSSQERNVNQVENNNDTNQNTPDLNQ